MHEVKPVRELDAAIPHVQFDERGVETKHDRDIVAPRGNHAATENTNVGLNYRATPRLY